MDTLYYRNPRLLILTICLILVSGISSYQLLPRLEDPELTQRFALIKTIYPGAGPERVETLVTDLLEEELRKIKEVKVIESKSNQEISIVNVELKDNVYDVDPVWSRVRDKLNDVTPLLPVGCQAPKYEEIYPRAYALIASITWQGEDEPNFAILKREAEKLEDQLRSLAGTEETKLYGAPDEEVLIEIDPGKLASLGLTAADVSNAIKNSDAKLNAGQLHSEDVGLLLEVRSEFQSIEHIRNTPIQAGENGQYLRLSDLAKITKGIRQPASELAIVNGQPAVAVSALVLSDTRIDLWAESAKEVVNRFQETLPSRLSLDVVFDQSLYTQARLATLQSNLLIGIVAVMLVITVMMGWKSALLVGSALPLTCLMVLSGMRFWDIPLHQMSITGLIIALGLMIDNAIIMVDEVRQRFLRGDDVISALRDAVRHMAIPLFGSTLTTVFSFAPIAMMPGPAGEFVGTIALTVIISLFCSLFVSLTIVTALTSLFHTSLTAHEYRGFWRTLIQDGIELPALARNYRAFLGAMLRHPRLTLVLTLILPFLGFYGGTKLQEQFFPAADRDQFTIEFELPMDASIEESREQSLALRELLLEREDVEQVHLFMGRSAPIVYYNLIENRFQASNFAQAIVKLKSAENYFQVIDDVQNTVNRRFPQVFSLARQFEQGPPFDAPIEIRIFGPDLETLRDLGEQVRAELSRTPGVIATKSDLSTTLPKLDLIVDEEQARLAGVSHADLAGQLAAQLEGMTGGSLMEATEELPIRVRIGDEHRGKTDQIMSLNLLSSDPGGRSSGETSRLIPLDAIGRMELSPDLPSISRYNRQRANTVQAFIHAGQLPQDVLDRFLERWDDTAITAQPGFRYSLGGESAERNNAVGNLMANVGILSVLMVATLVLSFSSFRLTLIIGTIGVLSVGLSLGSLWIFGYPFGFMGIVGTMGLIGVALNDSIVVLTAIHDDELSSRGNISAMVDVIVRSTRHVLSTTLTTTAGFIPLVLSGGGFWPPLAVTISGGVLGATLLALTYIPCVYVITMTGQRKPLAAVNSTTRPVVEGALAASHV